MYDGSERDGLPGEYQGLPRENKVELLRRKDAHLERMHIIPTRDVYTLRTKVVEYVKRIAEMEQPMEYFFPILPHRQQVLMEDNDKDVGRK